MSTRDLVPLDILQAALLPTAPYPHLDYMTLLPPSPPYAERSASPQPASNTRDTPVSDANTDSSNISDSSHRCLWVDCAKSYPDPETLYNHLCNDHIGRKSTNNLCLTCKWKDCGTTCAKRDHITSHLRVHTPLKPHICEICNKSFKRPQDLKKHEKIHTEEHHAQHKHSKAITVVDPAYVSRVRGEPTVNRVQSTKPIPSRHSPSQLPLSRSNLAADTKFDFGLLPTPSPEISPSSLHPSSRETPASAHDLFLQNQLPSWEVLKPDGSSASASAGAKRSHDYSVDDFFSDMKKRRVNPSYDPHMAERLNDLAFAQQLSGINHHEPYSSNFNPRSVSLDIRTPEELAAVNEFLVTLGRDVAAGGNQRSQSVHHHSSSGGYSPQSFFDATSLDQLGLAGMPGMPGSGANFSSDSGYVSDSPSQYSRAAYHPSQSITRSSHPSVQPGQYGSLYPSIQSPTSYSATQQFASPTHRSVPITGSPNYSSATPSGPHGSSYATHYPHASPPNHSRQTSTFETSSPHSSASTPSNATPPHIPISIPDNVAAFDYLRASRGPAPVAQLAAPEYRNKVMRTIVPLKSAPGKADVTAGRPEPIEPKLNSGIHPGPPAKLTSVSSMSASSSGSRSGSLYPLLTSGDVQYKLPPLNHIYRSPSPEPSSRSTSSPTRESTPSSTQSSPVPPSTTLPSLRSITHTSSGPGTRPTKRSSESDDLTRKIGRIELENRTKEILPEERRKHAELIRNLLVTINSDYKRRFGTPSSSGASARRLAASEMLRDVQMSTA